MIELQAIRCLDCGIVTDMSRGIAAPGCACPARDCGSTNTEVTWIQQD